METNINRMAARTGIAAEQIMQWQAAYGHQRSRNRPKGMLSVGDIGRKYGITARTLLGWRRSGLPSEPGKGKLVLIKETDLLKWMERDHQ